MSIVSDLVSIGLVGAIGLYLYNTDKVVKDAADITSDVIQTSIAPTTVSKNDFKQKSDNAINKINEDLGTDLPTLPTNVTNVLSTVSQNPSTPITSVVTEYATNQIVQESKKDPLTIVQDVTSNRNATTLITDTLTDLVTGKFKWTGFHF